MLNFALMRHWENWATVLLMVLIASFAINSISKMTQRRVEQKEQ